MFITESFTQAFSSLKTNRLRSVLTMLGIIMGVFSIIAIVTIGDAAKVYMNKKFEMLGSNLIQVKQKSKAVNEEKLLELEDIGLIKEAFTEVKDATGFTQDFGTIRVGSRTRDVVIIGTTPSYKNLNPIEIIEGGRFITDYDIKAQNNVVVVGEYFATKYFNSQYINGIVIDLKDSRGNSLKSTVVGVLKVNDNSLENMFGDDMPVIVFVPVTMLKASSGVKKLDQLLVALYDKEKLKDTGMGIVRLLNFKHGGGDTYMASNSADMQKTVSDIMDMIRWVLLVIAVITLIVGGIGIVNILLVSVTERIREIGVRKALGARKWDIVFQFLTESVIMTGTSGLVGILFGVAAGNIASALIKIPQVISIKVIIGAFAGSVLLGLVFGVYPAKRAAELDPIESLRYE